MIDCFFKLENNSEQLCKPLITEDYSVQAGEFTSPPKWHLAHTTWFWEEFILTISYLQCVYNDDFSFYSIAITITLVNVFYVLQEV
jgi:hypothetical protein